MAINPKCDKCSEELKDFWAILLSPPKDDYVRKYHICIECYNEIIKEIN